MSVAPAVGSPRMARDARGRPLASLGAGIEGGELLTETAYGGSPLPAGRTGPNLSDGIAQCDQVVPNALDLACFEFEGASTRILDALLDGSDAAEHVGRAVLGRSPRDS